MGAIAIACLLALPFGGAARAAFTGYNGASTDIAYDDATGVHSTGGLNVAGASDPVWRPDGGKIAYVTGGQIFVANADGTGAAAVATGTEPAWSSDGTKLAYVRLGEIYTANADGTGEVNVTNSLVDDRDPAWSPSGSQIAFARKVGDVISKYQIFVMNADGTGQTQLSTSITVNDEHPAYSPDGGTIAFQSDRDVNTQIYSMSSGGGSATRLTNTTSNEVEPTFSPEGDLIAFARPDPGGGIFTMPAGGGSATQVVSGAADHNPDFRAFAPLNTSPPSISGSLQVGATVSASPGSWRGAVSSKYTYQWSSCSSGSCTPISGATSSSYTIAGGDQGKTLRVAVSARNAGAAVTAMVPAPGVSEANSNETGFIGGEGPLILTLPKIIVGFGSLERAPTIGFSVSATTGTWQSQLPLTFKFQWRKCERLGGPCSDIVGATTSTLLVTGDLIGRELIIAVTAHNDKGDTYIESERSRAVTGLPPHSLGTPPIIGTNEVGQTLTVTGGLWSTVSGRAPTSIVFDWRRCDAFGNLPSCVSIPGATTTLLTGFGSSSYRLTDADLDKTIRVYITGRNSVGSETIITNHTFPTLPKRKFVPSATVPPSIKGKPHPGQRLTANIGTWSGDDPISYKVFWRRCDATAANCRTLNTKGAQTYMLRRADLGHTLIVIVLATNAAGATQASSAPTLPITLQPKSKRGRRIVGTNRSDYIAGGANDDTLLGRGGNDTIVGGAGNDLIDGGAGNDVLDGGRGADRIFGGTGSDTIVATDGDEDTIDCGPGNDRVFLDQDDTAKNCESVSYSAPPTSEP